MDLKLRDFVNNGKESKEMAGKDQDERAKPRVRVRQGENRPRVRVNQTQGRANANAGEALRRVRGDAAGQMVRRTAGRGGATAATGTGSGRVMRPAAGRAVGAALGSAAGRVAGRVGGALAGILAPTRAADAELPRGMGGRSSSGPVTRRPADSGKKPASTPRRAPARPAPKSNGEESADYLTHNARKRGLNAKDMAKRVQEDRKRAREQRGSK